MIITLYRKYISKSVRDKIYVAFLGKFLRIVRSNILFFKSKYIYIFYKFLSKTETNQLYAFIGKNGYIHIPYSFALDCKQIPVQVVWDKQQEMYYVVHEEKKLYFPSLNKDSIIKNYRILLMEQFEKSPHRYVEDINRLKGKTLLDVGAAEGIFTLNAIEIIEHAYLFECEDQWIRSLKATFAPWEDKVTIISKFVSDISDEKNITISLFLEGKSKTNLFIKMDVEGNESAVLKGAEKIFQDVIDIDFAICTYHKKEDANEFHQFCKKYSIETEFSEGLLYCENDLRKAIIRRK